MYKSQWLLYRRPLVSELNAEKMALNTVSVLLGKVKLFIVDDFPILLEQTLMKIYLKKKLTFI